MKLKHPDSKQSIEVTPEHADAYLSQGWAVDEPEPEKPAPPKK
jgi:hypothetical protein